MNEWLMIGIMIWCGGLFAAGGTDLNGKGYKSLRRFLMPFGLSIVAAYYAPWWAVLGYTASLCAILHIGYGSRCSWLKRAILFICYGAVSLWFGWSWWVVITPILLSILFLLSNTKLTAKSIFWKSWELLSGVLISFGFIASIVGGYR